MRDERLYAQQVRFASTAPTSYDPDTRSVDAVISMGSPVQRFYGTEVLRIVPDAVILDRVHSSGVPLLDSHQQSGISNAIGRVARAWFKSGALMGKIVFNDTERGREAEGMVARGEIAGISAGYRVLDWEITNGDGDVVDPDKQRLNLDDELTFTATRWELLEASLVAVPADGSAQIRSLSGSSMIRNQAALDALARMRVRQRMHDRQNNYEARQRMLDAQRGYFGGSNA
jgi:phage head maturation protease